MTIAELIRLLSDFPDYYRVMVGSAFVSEVRDQTQVIRERERHGGQATDGRVVVVIS